MCRDFKSSGFNLEQIILIKQISRIIEMRTKLNIIKSLVL